MATEAKHEKQVTLAKINLSEAEDLIATNNPDDTAMAYAKLGETIKRLELSKDNTMQYLMENDSDLETLKAWADKQKECILSFRKARDNCKQQMDKLKVQQQEEAIQSELENKKRINDEQLKFQLQQEKELQEVMIRKQQAEEEWLKKKAELQMQMQSEATGSVTAGPTNETQSTVKLEKYTITPFRGDYMDWLRFWNQFTVEVNDTKISDVSKFHYLLELVKGKPREDILGLPHTSDGYKEAKKILVENYGKDTKVHKALIKDLESLHTITSIHKLNLIHDFYNKLSRIVRSLTTMGKLETAQSAVYTLMDKLGPVREVLVQKDDEWENWGLTELVEHLHKFVNRNPIREEENEASGKQDWKKRGRWGDREKLLFGNDGERNKKKQCIYCESKEHTAIRCTKVLDVAKRREILKQKNSCYNCAIPGHRASTCRAQGCHKCGQKHHTSICQQKGPSSMEEMNNSKGEKGYAGIQHETVVDELGREKTDKALGAAQSNQPTVHPTLHAKIGDKKVRVMIDTGASSSYICSDLVTELKLTPVRKEKRCIEQMYGTVDKVVEIYEVSLQSLAVRGYDIKIECINAEKDILTCLPNPRIAYLKRQNPRLGEVSLCEEETTCGSMPVHVMLGVSDFQRIRTSGNLILGTNPDTDPGAEFTMLGWTVFGGKQNGMQPVKNFLLHPAQEEFEQLCNLDVLGVTDPIDKQVFVHENFKQQLEKNDAGFYETRLPWKPYHMTLPDNKQLSVARLHSTTRKLEKNGKLEEYNEIMQEQLTTGVIEHVPESPSGNIVHYVPHQPVIREQAESTKMRIVYDCSSKANDKVPSLNDCLETGPSLQPLLFDILVRNRFRRYCVTGDVKKAFLQIMIQRCDRDAQRVLWYDDLESRNITEYRFTRAIFGATSSPYILGATLEKHLEQYENSYTTTVKSLRDDTYVDDIQGGGNSEEDVIKFKVESTEIMNEAGFELHKWHSNCPAIESTNNANENETTYAKTLVGNASSNETKILGLPWNKKSDAITIDFETCIEVKKPVTKRKVIGAINSVYDILGWSSPIIITAKIIFAEICLLKKHWDEQLPDEILQKWFTWIKHLQQQSYIMVPRSVVMKRGDMFEIHGFSDASKVAVCAAIYVIEYCGALPISQKLLVAKSRIAPKNASIPRLELIAALTLAKLQNNVIKALENINIQTICNWVDSITVLYWLANKGTYSVFVRNRVKQITEICESKWLYVPTKDNPSDMGTRGSTPSKLGDLWFTGPVWLSSRDLWPKQPEISETKESAEERIPHKTLAMTEVDQDQAIVDEMLRKFTYKKLLRVTAYMIRFTRNAKGGKYSGLLKTEEILDAEKLWLRHVQRNVTVIPNVDLHKDKDDVWRVNSRIPGYCPAFIPRRCCLDRLLVSDVHEQIGHGGVSSTMAKVREQFWIPQLRVLVKSVIHECNKCKLFRVKPLHPPTTAPLPEFRTQMTHPFAVTGVDFAGPLLYRTPKKKTQKAYVTLFTCSTTRAVHLKLCKSMTAEEFKRSLKEFVARRGTPYKLVSDNALTFKAAQQWLDMLIQDEDLFNYLNTQRIEWSFNLARAPWWGGFFERMVGIMKASLSKVVGRALLKYEELEEVLLDIECFMNNRPLCYQEEEIEHPILTPNLLIHGTSAHFLEEDLEALDEKGLITKRMKFMKTCRQQLRKRWQTEYLHALEERHRKIVGKEETLPSKGSVVMITDSSKIKSKWQVGRIVDTIRGKDGVLRGYKIKTGTGYVVERPIQLVCDLEIKVCKDNEPSKKRENKMIADKSQDVEPKKRPQRKAKSDAINVIKGVSLNELED